MVTGQTDVIASESGTQGHADCQAKFVCEAASGHKTRQYACAFFTQ